MKTNGTSRLTLALLGILVFFTPSTCVMADDLTPTESLGKFLFFDKISSPDSMSCAACHDPDMGFTGPIPGVNKHGAVYKGAAPQRFGNRKPPSAAYATLSPLFHYDEAEGLFVGGNFWDGRATGEKLGNPAADQALGPFLNPVEQNNPSKRAVLEQIAVSSYADLWEEVFGEPISFETEEDIEENYDRVGLAIAAYEASREVNPFSSKYDFYLAGEVELTEQEALGLELFNGKAQCSACHPSAPAEGEPPLFTDFTFDNLGVPRNPENPFYEMDEIFLDDGTPINPAGADWIDPGLGGFLESRPEWADFAAANWGKHKVPTLRNVDKRPGNNTPKAFMHNGVFKSLEEVVHFYNTRDVEDWPEPEVSENVNTDELGNLGLTNKEEAAIVAFMRTLSDGYTPPKVKDKGEKLSIFDEAVDMDFYEWMATEEALAFVLLDETVEIIDQLGPEHFRNEESAFELADEVTVVFWLLDDGMYDEALMVLGIDVLERVNGYALSGEPDLDDWITSYEGQLLVYPLLLETAEHIASLI